MAAAGHLAEARLRAYSWAVSGLPDEPHSGTPRELFDRLEAERRGTPFLVFRDDEGHQHLVDLAAGPGRLAVGRRLSCAVAVPWDVKASRLHAELERIAGEWTLVDDGRSSNGTFLNGRRLLGRKRLADGDVIAIGGTLMLFRDPAAQVTWATTLPGSDATLDISPAQKRVLIALCRPLTQAGTFATPASNRAIASELVVSLDTVKTHLRALFDVFGIGDAPQNEKRALLARAAIEQGHVTFRDLEPAP
jgi:hypothetical protein